MITIEQFRTIELKVGTVRAAEPHPNADRLLVLRVDLGGGSRQCASTTGSGSSAAPPT